MSKYTAEELKSFSRFLITPDAKVLAKQIYPDFEDEYFDSAFFTLREECNLYISKQLNQDKEVEIPKDVQKFLNLYWCQK